MFAFFKCCCSFPQQTPAVSIPVPPASNAALPASSTDIQTAIQDLKKKNLSFEQAQTVVATKFQENDVVALEAALHLFPEIQLKYTHNADPTDQFFKAAEKGCELFISKSLEYHPNLVNSSVAAEAQLTVLATAVGAGQAEVVGQILKHAADHLNKADAVNALTMAKALGHTEIVNLFSAHGIV